MRNKLITSIFAASLLACAGPVFAGTYGDEGEAEETPAAAPAAAATEEVVVAEFKPYLYGGVGGLYAIELFDDDGARTNNSGGLDARLGWRLHRHVALEGLYQWYAEFDTDPGYLSGWSTTVNVKGIFLPGRFEPYAVMGLGYLDHNESRGNPVTAADIDGDGSFMMRFGGGLDVWVTDWLGIAAELAYVLPFEHDGVGDMRFLTLSLGVNFRTT